MVVALLLLLVAGNGDVVDPDVRAGIEKYRLLEFHAVIPLLKGALERSDLSDHDRQQALAYLGRTYASFRKPRRAEKVFVQLLELDPAFEVLPSESPVIRDALARARASLPSAEAPAVSEPEAVAEPEVDVPPKPEVVDDPEGDVEGPDVVGVAEPAVEILEPSPVVPPVEEVTGPPRVAAADDDDWSVWWWVGVGAVVLVAGTVALVATEPWADDARRVGTMGAWDLP